MKLTKAQKKAKKALRNKINETDSWDDCFKLYKKFVKKYGTRIRWVEEQMEKDGLVPPKKSKKQKAGKKKAGKKKADKPEKEVPLVVSEIVEKLRDGIASCDKDIARLEKQKLEYEKMIARFLKPYGLD